MQDEAPRVISVASLETAKQIDGGLAVAIELLTPDDRPFAILLSRALAAELKERLAEVLEN